MSNVDYNKIAFNKTLFTGTLTEIAVERLINDDDGTLASQLCPRSTITFKAVEAPLTADYDSCFHICDNNGKVLEAFYSNETKSAVNGGRYPNFFWETCSTRSNTYPEFLVSVPTFLTMVDVVSGEAFFYDGETLVSKIKQNIHLERMNSYKTARGILVGCEDRDWGFICKAKVQDLEALAKEAKEEIKQRMWKGKVPALHKKCPGLPDLS